jgi:MFS family permease
MYYLVVSFSIVYLKSVDKYDTSSLLLALLIAHVVHFVVIPQIGRLADSWGRKPVYLIGAISGATWPFFAFPMFDTKNPAVIVAAVTIGLCLHAFMYAGQPAIMTELFPTRMRYSGVSLGSQVTSIFAGSLAPLLATQWLKNTGSWMPTAIYLVISCAITAVVVLTLKETRGVALEDVDNADAVRHGLPMGARA